MSLTDAISLIIALATIASAVFAVHHLQVTTQTNKVLKRADVSMHCTIRYEELKRIVSDLEQKFRDRPSDPAVSNEEAKAQEALRETLWKNYYSRYWALKSDQFDFWLYGLLEHGTFLDWTYSTALAFWKDTALTPLRPSCPFAFKESWIRWKKNDHGPVNPHFVKFTDRVLSLVDHSSSNGPQALEVLGVIKTFHGTPGSPGVSRVLQEQAWKGVSLEHLEKILVAEMTRAPAD